MSTHNYKYRSAIVDEINANKNEDLNICKTMKIEEEPWNERTETYVWEKQKEARNEANKQNAEGDRNKKMYYILSIPSILIPLVMTFIVPLLSENTQRWVPQFFFMLTSVVSSISGLMNYGEKYGTNYAFSKDYQTIISMIQLEMSRKREFRRVADVFMNEIRLRMEFLNRESPTIENFFNCMGCLNPENPYNNNNNNADDSYNNYKKTDNILGLNIV